jgi:hypothetical protein
MNLSVGLPVGYLDYPAREFELGVAQLIVGLEAPVNFQRLRVNDEHKNNVGGSISLDSHQRVSRHVANRTNRAG